VNAEAFDSAGGAVTDFDRPLIDYHTALMLEVTTLLGTVRACSVVWSGAGRVPRLHARRARTHARTHAALYAEPHEMNAELNPKP
jgi:hypothetical protein